MTRQLSHCAGVLYCLTVAACRTSVILIVLRFACSHTSLACDDKSLIKSVEEVVVVSGSGGQ